MKPWDKEVRKIPNLNQEVTKGLEFDNISSLFRLVVNVKERAKMN